MPDMKSTRLSERSKHSPNKICPGKLTPKSRTITLPRLIEKTLNVIHKTAVNLLNVDIFLSYISEVFNLFRILIPFIILYIVKKKEI